MDDLQEKIKIFREWKDTSRVVNSCALSTLSAGKLVFFTAHTSRGFFSNFMDLTHAKTENLLQDLEKNLTHIESIGNRHGFTQK